MGWNSWNRFHLDISDPLIRAQAHALVRHGLHRRGYEYVVIDGGWEGYHDARGVFHSNALKFPDMKRLCDYIHGLGLKVGLHDTPGPVTCSGREGSYGHEEQDARTFAGWGIDFIKYDWCSASRVYRPDQMQFAYRKMADALRRSGRPMLYSLCQYGRQEVWKWGRAVGAQMWRTTGDISDKYYRMAYIGFEQNGLERFAGPGGWNDPDCLEIGNGGMRPEEYRTQMTLWCLLAAPLFAGNDLTRMDAHTLALLSNPELIAIDQDRAGRQGRRVWQEGPLQIWLKPLADGGAAVGLFNRDEHPMTMALRLRALRLPDPCQVRDCWQSTSWKTIRRGLRSRVPPHGARLFRIKPAD